MGRVSYEKLRNMQKNQHQIRNISILAHVDHGKTSIADLLLASNAILSKRQAGLLRYLDSRPDEQRRGITMKSSTVALYYIKESTTEEFLVNIIDSPGHIDFASEVSAAARISDGTLIVVDVVEGMCAQTVTALETAIWEKTQMILVLNKMDRLFLEKSMDTEEIHMHLTILLETINACVADIRYKELSLRIEELGDIEQDDNEFNPNIGNVIFASAIDGWAFRIIDFANIYSQQLNKSVEHVTEHLWGDFYFDKKIKDFSPGAREAGKKPLFATMILENVLALYDCTVISKNDEKIAKIIDKLKLINKTREMSSTDKRVQLKAIMSEWLPLAETVLASIVELIPSPTKISADKVNHILGKDFPEDDEKTTCSSVEPFIQTCSSEEKSPTIAYVTKVYAIDKRNILTINKSKIPTIVDIQAKREAVRKMKQALEAKDQLAEILDMINVISLSELNSKETKEEDDHLDFIACVRIFSGTLKLGDELYLLPSAHSPYVLNSDSSEDMNKTTKNITKIKVEELFMLLGKDVIQIDSSIAGNIVGIGKLRNYMIRSGTLSSTLDCGPLIESTKDTVIEPFYKCAIEPKQVSDMQALLQGVKLLIQSDSCAQCVLQDNGQYVLMTAGHVHLEKCVEDVKNFTGVEFKMSSPMVQLRETIISPVTKPDNDTPYESKALIGMGIKLTIRAYPMHTSLQKFITENYTLLKKIEYTKDDSEIIDETNKFGTEKQYKNVYTYQAVQQLKTKLEKTFAESNSNWKNTTNRLMAIGDSRNDCCILLNLCNNFEGKSIFHKTDPNDPITYVQNCIINGFQLGLRTGPICDEPIKSLIFGITEFELSPEYYQNRFGLMTGVVLKEVKDLIHKTFSIMSPRLMEPMYSARMTVDNTMMGKIQNRLDQYRGRITETYLVAKGLTDVEFVIPVLESPEFCNKLRADTQGKINPLLNFSHFEMIDQSPYNEPVITDDDDEDEIQNQNLANKLMNEVRKRKGLRVDEKIVNHAEKQRTLNKKK